MRTRTDRTAWDQMPAEYESSSCANCDVPGGAVCDSCGGAEWEPEHDEPFFGDEIDDEIFGERLETESEDGAGKRRVLVNTTVISGRTEGSSKTRLPSGSVSGPARELEPFPGPRLLAGRGKGSGPARELEPFPGPRLLAGRGKGSGPGI